MPPKRKRPKAAKRRRNEMVRVHRRENPDADPRPRNARERLELQKALRLYRKIHGVDPVRISRVSVPWKRGPKYLVDLGRAVDVSYKPTGRSRRAGGPPYLHRFGGSAILSTDPAGKTLLTIDPKNRVRVTSRGILG